MNYYSKKSISLFRSFFAFNLASEHHQLHIKLKRSPINIEKNNYNDLNIPLKVNTKLQNNRNNDGKFLRKLWHRPKSSNDFIAYEKKLSIRPTTENFRNEYDEYNNVDSSFKLVSPNRNRVKMGTRVWTSAAGNSSVAERLDECSMSYISTKNTYLKNRRSSTDALDSQQNQLSRCVRVKKCNTEDELSSRKSSISKHFNLDSDGVTSNSNEAYVIGK